MSRFKWSGCYYLYLLAQTYQLFLIGRIIAYNIQLAAGGLVAVILTKRANYNAAFFKRRNNRFIRFHQKMQTRVLLADICSAQFLGKPQNKLSNCAEMLLHAVDVPLKMAFGKEARKRILFKTRDRARIKRKLPPEALHQRRRKHHVADADGRRKAL